MIENITKWNYKADFSVIFRFSGGVRPNYPWQMAFITDSEHSHASKIFYVGFDGANYTNCTFINCPDDSVRVEFKDHKLAPGRLRYEFQREVPNDLFLDGKQHLFDPHKTHIELHRGPSDDSETPPEITIITERISRGLSAYELYQQHNPDSTLTQEQYAAAPIVAAGMATDLIESAAELEGQIVRAEELRGEGEGTRERSETLREDVEVRRVLAEGERATAETTRAKTEDERGIVETLRVDAEGRRVLAEDKRVTADAHRDTTEKQRTATETARVEAEGLRATAEQGRQTTTTSAIERTNSATTTATEAAASIIDPLEVLAHSDCSMEERVANLEKALISLITGEMLIPMLSVEKLDVWRANNIVLSGGGAPAHSPSRAGQLYIDTTNKAVYFSTGNSSVADWNH